ncbi:hypothetical protein B0G69_3652 [Paraburkholderia sp. RAU2J]|nr:hypothetical protein B0G69_3652 [Paraburkholderia sp. RAU2J]
MMPIYFIFILFDTFALLDSSLFNQQTNKRKTRRPRSSTVTSGAALCLCFCYEADGAGSLDANDFGMIEK